MNKEFININEQNIDTEHLCCAIADKKHQEGVMLKKEWLKERIKEGHIFRKLNDRGKVFIEYAPIENAWVPIVGKNYLYIYCLWVSGSFKGKGYAKELLNYCIDDAKKQNKSGVCILSSKKKKPFLSDKKFMTKYGFEVVDEVDGEYQLLALSFDGSKPKFSDSIKKMEVEKTNGLTIYYSNQCPFINDSIVQITNYCEKNAIELNLIKIDTLEKAKNIPYIFNNFIVFYNGEFLTNRLLNENVLKKMIG